MQRITEKQLENLVERINHITGQPEAAYTRDENGKFTANIGSYHLSWVYGGVELHQMATTGGGVRVIISGYGTKREMYNKLHSFISGIDAGRTAA
jgi:hypothetical protein